MGTSGVRADRHRGPGKRALTDDESRPRARARRTVIARALTGTAEIGRAVAELIDEDSMAPPADAHAVDSDANARATAAHAPP